MSEYLSSTNLNITRGIRNWRVDPELSFSDHKWITFEIRSDVSMPEKFRNPRKTDWAGFRDTLSELADQSLTAISSRKELDLECDRLRKSIMQAYETNCPLSSPPPLGKRSAWSVELSEMKKKENYGTHTTSAKKNIVMLDASQIEMNGKISL